MAEEIKEVEIEAVCPEELKIATDRPTGAHESRSTPPCEPELFTLRGAQVPDEPERAVEDYDPDHPQFEEPEMICRQSQETKLIEEPRKDKNSRNAKATSFETESKTDSPLNNPASKFRASPQVFQPNQAFQRFGYLPPVSPVAYFSSPASRIGSLIGAPPHQSHLRSILTHNQSLPVSESSFTITNPTSFLNQRLNQGSSPAVKASSILKQSVQQR